MRVKLKEISKNLSGYKIALYLILFLGCLIRLAGLGVFPDGDALNPDEAFAGYEAYSMLHYHMDSHGYSMPVYLVAWGSGMNALNTYLMIQFVLILGLTPLAIRLPQAIVACFSLYVFYRILKKNHSELQSLIGLAVFSIMPWHIMLARFGLESNLLPGFLLFGMYFLIRGIDDSKYLVLSAVFYGLSLYCYAAAWPIMPIIILGGWLIYLFTAKRKLNKCFLLSIFILCLLALPLLLFCLVNYGYMPEMKFGPLSIPKLSAIRSIEIQKHTWEWKKNFLDAAALLMRQYDYLPWNATEKYGLYYHGGLILAVIGAISTLIQFISAFVKSKGKGMSRRFMPQYLFMLQGFAACVLASLLENMLDEDSRFTESKYIYMTEELDNHDWYEDVQMAIDYCKKKGYRTGFCHSSFFGL